MKTAERNDETLNDRAISTMMEIQKAKEAIQPFNAK